MIPWLQKCQQSRNKHTANCRNINYKEQYIYERKRKKINFKKYKKHWTISRLIFNFNFSLTFGFISMIYILKELFRVRDLRFQVKITSFWICYFQLLRRYYIRGNGSVKITAIYVGGGRNSVYSLRLQNSHCSCVLSKVEVNWGRA